MVRRWAVLAAACVLAGCGDADAGAPSSTPPPLAFESTQGGVRSVVLMDADGRGRRRVLTGGAHSPDWTPDGASLVFVRETAEGRGHLAIAAADGTGERALTSGDGSDLDPAVSPDGAWVAFARPSAGEGLQHSALFLIRPDGSGLRRITSGKAFDGEPSWSPDGRRLAFRRSVRRGDFRFDDAILIVDLASGRARRLTEGGSPAWSPDGRRIAYATSRAGFGETCFHECSPAAEIHAIGADGRGDRRLTRSRASDVQPAWAAGGEQILFASDRFEPARHDNELYVMRADGRCVTRLTNTTSWSMAPAATRLRLPCGTAPGAVRARSEADLAPARAFAGFPLLWLGARHEGRLLSDVLEDGAAWTFIYTDCARRRASDCGPPVQVRLTALCSTPRSALRRAGTVRGVPRYAFRFPRRRPATYIGTGGTDVQIHAPSRAAIRRAFAALRPLDGAAGGALPPPARTCA